MGGKVQASVMQPSSVADRYVVRSILLLVSLVSAACGSSGRETPAPERVSLTVPETDIDLRSETRAFVARVSTGTTLASLLRTAQLSAAEVIEVIDAVRTVFDPRKVRSEQPYRVVQSTDGALRRFEYEIDNDRFLRVSRPRGADAVWRADILPIPKTTTPVVVAGTIDRETPSLFAAMADAGGTVDLSLALADIFSGDIDFNTELQPGDRFSLSVDKQFRDGGGAFVGYGPIQAVEFENDGRRIRAVRFTQADGSSAYFDERGVSMRRFMLKSPLKFDPIITSGFSRSRVHPVLGGSRAHLGVDYRAPVGAPVVAVAGGLVVQAGVNGGAGRMVHLRHANGFETEYLHLSSVAVRPGVRVAQGDLIGRVGATGLATGPHLDYRVRKNGAFINPLTATQQMPPADPVPEARMAEFAAVRDRLLRELTIPTP
jgi:murein DD-endopeptidase MepM/ murein hydrolase activator NlpD